MREPKEWKVGEFFTYPVDFGYRRVLQLSTDQVKDLFQRFIPEVKIYHDLNINECIREKVDLDRVALNKMFVVILPGNIAVYKHDFEWSLIQLSGTKMIV